MLKTAFIKKLFIELNTELKKLDVIGEIGICGGAVMCLVFQARQATKDIDGIFEPTKEIRLAVHRVAQRNGLGDDWLNDAAKSYFHIDPPKEDVIQLSNLRVWAPIAEYMLAMKAVSARFESRDKDDLIFLIDYLSLKSPTEVFDIVCKYYPKEVVPAKTHFLVEEIFDKKT